MGHDAWTAAGAGLSDVADDELTVYATDKGSGAHHPRSAVQPTPCRNVVGEHLWLDRKELDAAGPLELRLPEFIDQLDDRFQGSVVVGDQ